MHIHLDERRVADAREAVNLSGLDDQDVAGTRLEFHAADVIASAALPHELDFVVRMTMRPWPFSGKRVEEKHRDVHVALIDADELVRAADEGQVLLAHSVHSRELLRQA